MKVKYLPIWAIRGATAWEFQVWRFGLRILYPSFWWGCDPIEFHWYGKSYDS